ncbi:MAG: hypothetical protein K9H49_02890 [Bacteroidales bacterium]|nr:hypothetical protein [Bacteroidales bacterium]MCF8389204.1 hypothetical protein [Bacteroidales bacterium]
MNGVPLLREDYKPSPNVLKVKKPDIVSGSVYYFETASKLTYQVIFGKKKNNYLGNIVNFSVLSEDFEDEYSETNRGEVYSIISTLIYIIQLYHEAHPYSNSYEFSGEYKDDEDTSSASIRTRLYIKTAYKFIDLNYWEIHPEGNKVLISRKPRIE